jgi:hypothetical protein
MVAKLAWVSMVTVGLSAATSGCCGGGPSHKCAAEMDGAVGAYTSTGAGDNKADAEKEAVAGVCIWYCERGDPIVEAAYQKYLTTPEGRKDAKSKTMSVVTVPDVKRAYELCKVRCNGDVASKKLKVTATCTK